MDRRANAGIRGKGGGTLVRPRPAPAGGGSGLRGALGPRHYEVPAATMTGAVRHASGNEPGPNGAPRAVVRAWKRNVDFLARRPKAGR